MSEQAERMAAGEWYLDDDDLRERRRRCARLVDAFNAAPLDRDDIRAGVLGELIGAFGAGARVVPRLSCSYGRTFASATGPSSTATPT